MSERAERRLLRELADAIDPRTEVGSALNDEQACALTAKARAHLSRPDTLGTVLEAARTFNATSDAAALRGRRQNPQAIGLDVAIARHDAAEREAQHDQR